MQRQDVSPSRRYHLSPNLGYNYLYRRNRPSDEELRQMHTRGSRFVPEMLVDQRVD